MSNAGYFDDISNAQAGFSKDYLLAGTTKGDRASYLVRVGGVELGKTRKHEPFIAAELEVLDAHGTGAVNPVGSKPKWFAKFAWDSTLGLFKRFCATCLGIGEEAVDPSGAEAAVGKDQPLKGSIIRVDVQLVETKNGGAFTQTDFRPASPEEVARYQAAAA
jgi:hypothetical protein